MNQMYIRVMIVEDEPEVMEEYRNFIRRRSMLQLVAEAGNQDDALQMLETIPVDALILDLELKQGSGILLLEKLQMMQIEKPFITVVTNVVSRVIYDAIRKMGVDYICAKGDANFSLDVPLSVIEISAPYRKTREQATTIVKTLNTRTKMDTYRRNIEFELSRMGFRSKMLGTCYCIEGMLYLAMSEQKEISMTKEVYPHVASIYKTNAKNVERGIRNAIERVWTEQEVDKLRELYPYGWNQKTGRPTNAEFLYNMVQKMRRQ